MIHYRYSNATESQTMDTLLNPINQLLCSATNPFSCKIFFLEGVCVRACVHVVGSGLQVANTQRQLMSYVHNPSPNHLTKPMELKSTGRQPGQIYVGDCYGKVRIVWRRDNSIRACAILFIRWGTLKMGYTKGGGGRVH